MTRDDIIKLGAAIMIQCQLHTFDSHKYNEDIKSTQGQYDLWSLFENIVEKYLNISKKNLDLAEVETYRQLKSIQIEDLEVLDKNFLQKFYQGWVKSWLSLAEFYQGRILIQELNFSPGYARRIQRVVKQGQDIL